MSHQQVSTGVEFDLAATRCPAPSIYTMVRRAKTEIRRHGSSRVASSGRTVPVGPVQRTWESYGPRVPVPRHVWRHWRFDSAADARPDADGHAALAPRAAAAFTTSGGGRRADVSGATVLWAPPDGGGDQVTLRVSQPLRVEAGGARFTVPVGRTPEGAVLRSSFAAGLEPSGRQIDVSAEWRRPLAGTAGVAAAATWTRHPGHAAGRGPGLGLFLGLTAEF